MTPGTRQARLSPLGNRSGKAAWLNVHAKTGLTEPVRHQARQQPGSGEGPGPGKGAVSEPRGCSAMTGRRAVLPPSSVTPPRLVFSRAP